MAGDEKGGVWRGGGRTRGKRAGEEGCRLEEDGGLVGRTDVGLEEDGGLVDGQGFTPRSYPSTTVKSNSLTQTQSNFT